MTFAKEDKRCNICVPIMKTVDEVQAGICELQTALKITDISHSSCDH